VVQRVWMMSTRRYLPRRLQFVKVTVKRRDLGRQTLTLANCAHELGMLGALLKRVADDDGPVIEHALREGLAGSLLAEIASEAERLGNGEVSFDLEDGCSDTLLLLNHTATAPVQAAVDATDSLLRASNIHKVDGLQETRLGSQAARIHASTSSGHNLTSTAVDRVSVHGDIQEVPTDTAAVLLGENTLLGRNLKTTHNGILDFVEVLHGLGGVDDKVGAGSFGSESPDLAGVVDVPLVFLVQNLATGLLFVTGGNGALLNLLNELLLQRAGSHIQTIVLVGGLRETDLVRGADNSFTVRNNWVGDLDFSTTHEVLGEIVQADFQMQLTSASHNVLSRLLDGALNQRVTLRQTLEAFDELGQVAGILDVDGNAYNGGHGKLHGAKRPACFRVSDGTSLCKKLIDTGKHNSVTNGDGVKSLHLSRHLDQHTLDVLDVHVILLSWNVVGAENADLGASAHSAGKHTAECEETGAIGGGNHLRHEEEEGAVGVALAEGGGSLVVLRSFVQVLHTVLLGLEGRRQVGNHHLKQTTAGGASAAWQPS